MDAEEVSSLGRPQGQVLGEEWPGEIPVVLECLALTIQVGRADLETQLPGKEPHEPRPYPSRPPEPSELSSVAESRPSLPEYLVWEDYAQNGRSQPTGMTAGVKYVKHQVDQDQAGEEAPTMIPPHLLP